MKTRVKCKKNWQDHCDSTSHFQTPESHDENDSKTRKLSAVLLMPRDVEQHLFACEQLLEKQRRKGFLHRIVTEDEKWTYYDKSQAQQIMGTSRLCFHVDGQTEYSQFKDHALYLMGQTRHSVL